MTKFTKGPWRVTTSETHAGTYTIENDAEAFEEMTSSASKRHIIARDEPNRRLIEAAPELFALVVNFTKAHSDEHFTRQVFDKTCSCRFCERARVLIAQVDPQ